MGELPLMVDLADRGEREATLARKLGKAMAEARRMLLAAVEDGVIDDGEWAAIAGQFQTALQVELEGTAFAAGLAAAEALGVGVDSAALDATNRQLLQQTIGDYFANRLTLADVEARLTQAFGPVRAQTIAITEVTRASSEGRQAYARELEQMGLQPVLIWNTANDDIACPICAPLNGRAQHDGWVNPPPAHPNCRCGISTEIRDATR